jgi:hypothetical protein
VWHGRCAPAPHHSPGSRLPALLAPGVPWQALHTVSGKHARQLRTMALTSVPLLCSCMHASGSVASTRTGCWQRLHLGFELGVATQLRQQRVLEQHMICLKLVERLLVAVQGPVAPNSRT